MSSPANSQDSATASASGDRSVGDRSVVSSSVERRATFWAVVHADVDMQLPSVAGDQIMVDHVRIERTGPLHVGTHRAQAGMGAALQVAIEGHGAIWAASFGDELVARSCATGERW